MARRGENIYKRKDGRYEGRYVKGRGIEGKTLFGYVYGHSYAEVKAALTLAKAAAGRGAPIRMVGRGSLSEFLRYWLENVVKGRVKVSTLAQYHERVHTHIIPALGNAPVCRLTREQAQGFVDALAGRGLAPSTVRNIAGLLRSAMKKAEELGLAASNPCDGLALPREGAGGRRALDRAEQVRLERLLPAAGAGTELGVLLALYAGLRIGEICALRWRDVDLASGTVTVRGTLQRVKNLGGGGARTALVEGAPKSRRSERKIPLPADLTDRLRAHGAGAHGDFYVVSGRGEPVEPHTFRSRFNRLAARAGLDVTFHCMRHTFATRCLEHNFDMQTVAELLGHATAGVTMKVYAHSVLEHKRMLTSRVRILSGHHNDHARQEIFSAEEKIPF